MPGTFVSAAGGTFETVMPGTFHSATGGTFETVLGGTIKPLPSKHDLLYIGKASVSLRERLWEEELHHARPATFFRSIGAILGFRPEKGSLYGKDTRNYQFSKENTNTIIAWMKEHLLVNFITISSNLGVNEDKLILENKPIINILKNPYKMEILNELRDECVRIAKEK